MVGLGLNAGLLEVVQFLILEIKSCFTKLLYSKNSICQLQTKNLQCSRGVGCTRKSDIVRYSVAKRGYNEENKEISLFPFHKQISLTVASIFPY